jgi:hypothetical protein
MTHVDAPQQRLTLPSRPVAVEVADVRAQPTGAAAIVLCATRAGKQDKAIALDLGLDPATWSRVKSGTNSLSLEQLASLMQVCGNTAPLIWLLARLGYDPGSLKKLESAVEKENRELREELGAMRRAMRGLLQDAAA